MFLLFPFFLRRLPNTGVEMNSPLFWKSVFSFDESGGPLLRALEAPSLKVNFVNQASAPPAAPNAFLPFPTRWFSCAKVALKDAPPFVRFLPPPTSLKTPLNDPWAVRSARPTPG